MTTQNHIDLNTPDDNPPQEWVKSEWIMLSLNDTEIQVFHQLQAKL